MDGADRAWWSNTLYPASSDHFCFWLLKLYTQETTTPKNFISIFALVSIFANNTEYVKDPYIRIHKYYDLPTIVFVYPYIV